MTHKISRLKSKQDVIVAGSEYDYRKPAKTINRLTARQLEAQINRAAQFLDRGTQFVPDAHHRPIPAAEFKALNVAQQARFTWAQEHLNQIGDTPTSAGTETIRQRRDKMKSDRKLAGNPSVNDPFEPKVNKSTDISNRKAIKTLLKQAKAQTGPGWDNKELKRQIGEFTKMINRIGDADLAAKVGRMSAAQFRTLWNGEGFAAAVSTQYEIVRTTLIDDGDKPWHATVIHDAFADARRMADWALTLDPDTGAARVEPEPPAAKPKRSRKKK